MDKTVTEAVRGFAATMGLNQLDIPESGLLQFSFEEAGTFFIEIREEGVAFYLLREVPDYELNDRVSTALRLCHYRENHRFDVQTALHEHSGLIFLIWLYPQRIDVPRIEQVLQHLVQLHDKTGGR